MIRQFATIRRLGCWNLALNLNIVKLLTVLHAGEDAPRFASGLCRRYSDGQVLVPIGHGPGDDSLGLTGTQFGKHLETRHITVTLSPSLRSQSAQDCDYRLGAQAA